MYASGSSPPPHDTELFASAPVSAPDTPASNPTPNGTNSNTLHVLNAPAPAPNRKRKRGQVASATHAASPAPSDPGSTAAGNGNVNGVNDLLASRTDLYARPILNISRGPTFIPISDDSEWFKCESPAINRLGYRYVPAGINPPGFITPCRTIESNPTSFRISWEDRSPSLKVTKDGLGLGGFKGFRSARCNAPMREGKWYLEVKIELGGGDQAPDAPSRAEGSHVRLGWGRREAPLNGPVGLDGYSYGVRDKTGEKVTLSRPRPYGKPFKTGDVVGMYISLPPRRQPSKKDPHDPAHIHRERIPIDLKGQEVFEILEYPTVKEMTTLMDHPTKATSSASLPSSSTKKPATGAKAPDRAAAPAEKKNTKTNNTTPLRPLPILEGSRIAFFVNGECQGTAFENLYDFLPLRQTDNQRKAKGRRVKEGVKEHRENPFDDGTLGYYPMISVFNDALVKINPGPDFHFPPPRDIDALLDGRPQPPEPVKVEPSESGDDVKMDVDRASDPNATQPDGLPTTPNAPTPLTTWRPAIERYPEFMQEQWALDALEEEEAKAEFEKQKAKEEAGATSKAASGKARGGAKGEGAAGSRKAAAAKAGAASRKKKASGATTEQSSVAGTPAPGEDLPSSSAAGRKTAAEAARAKKKAKKGAEAQAALGLQPPVPAHTEASTPRSATETPAGTPPPPSVSSTAAAAAAAHLHLHHHGPGAVAGRQEQLAMLSASRPSPSPLRQSMAAAAYPRDAFEYDPNTGLGEDEEYGDRDVLPQTHLQPTHTPSAHLQGPGQGPPPRSRAPPGSKEGRQRAAAHAVAAANQVFSASQPVPQATGMGMGQRVPPNAMQLTGPGMAGGARAPVFSPPPLVAAPVPLHGQTPGGSLMSLAALATATSGGTGVGAGAPGAVTPTATVPGPTPVATTVPVPSLGARMAGPGVAPVPVSYQAQYRAAGGARVGAHPSSYRPEGEDEGASAYNEDDEGTRVREEEEEEEEGPGGQGEENDDVEDEFLAAAGASSESEGGHHLDPEEEEEEEEDEGNDSEVHSVRVGGSRYAPYRSRSGLNTVDMVGDDELEEEEEGDSRAASVPVYDGRRYEEEEEEGATTDGGESRFGMTEDVEMESDDAGGVLAEGYQESGTRFRSPS